MENVAFNRAARFLNYLPTAKWLSILCGVTTAVLFVGLLLVLALYADLMVGQGAVPARLLEPTPERSPFVKTIRDSVGDDAADVALERIHQAHAPANEDWGILSLVVSSHDTMQGQLAGFLA